MSGRVRVFTEHSCYLVDVSEGWVQREPDAGMGESPDLPKGTPPLPAQASRLRMDGERIPLVELEVLEVGKPMVMYLQIRDDGVMTLRQTTFVREIQPV